MKIKFRVTQLTLFLVILIPIVVTLSLAGYWAVRYTGEDLGDQLVDQTSARIEQEIQKLLCQATEETALTADFIHAGRLDVTDFPGVVAFLDQLLRVSHESTSMFIAREDTGECIGISRLNGEPTVWELTVNEQRQQILREYKLADYPQHPFRTETNVQIDIRKRPWFVSAREKGAGTWPESYVFLGVEGAASEMGVTYSQPVYDAAGDLQAVVSADYSLLQISKFLQGMRIGQSGYAFVVELRDDGTHAVIAHPNPSLLLRNVDGEPQLIPIDQSPDPVVVACLSSVGMEEASTGEDLPLHFSVREIRFMGEVRRIIGEGSPPWLICIALPEDDVLGNVHRVTAISTVLGVSAVAIVILLSMYISSQVAIPLEKLAHEAELIGHLDLATRTLPRSVVLEVDRLSVATDEMKTGLRSFQKFVPPKVVRQLLSSNEEASFGGEKRCISIMFGDIVNFTSTAEGLSPEDLVLHLRHFLTVVSDAIYAAEGTVDKYIGDAVMAFWGAPQDNPEHALAACRAALAVQAQLAEARAQWVKDGLPAFYTRFGINTGDVVVGNMGSDTRLSYTAIGDAVNLASRLEGLNKEFGTNILISETTRVAAGEAIVTRPLDFVAVKGKQVAVPVHEVLGLATHVTHEQLDLARRSKAALDLYRQRSFSIAADVCEEILRKFTDDIATQRLLNRCLQFEHNPPAEQWDGTYHALSK